MHEFRTRSSLLSVAENIARIIPQQTFLEYEVSLVASVGVMELAGFDTHEIVSALRVLLHALREEAALSPFGWVVTRWDIEQRLSNLRRFSHEEKRSPQIVEEPIVAPIVITGLPRSGTTFLQTLLAEDPTNDVLRCWQAFYPY